MHVSFHNMQTLGQFFEPLYIYVISCTKIFVTVKSIHSTCYKGYKNLIMIIKKKLMATDGPPSWWWRNYSTSESTSPAHSCFAALISVSEMFDTRGESSPETLACFLSRETVSTMTAMVNDQHTEQSWAYVWGDEGWYQPHVFSSQNPW